MTQMSALSPDHLTTSFSRAATAPTAGAGPVAPHAKAHTEKSPVDIATGDSPLRSDWDDSSSDGEGGKTLATGKGKGKAKR